MKRRIYLDHAATTPVLPEARAAMAAALEVWANPSSPHAEGRAARRVLEDARRAVADALEWRHDVIFTSGASEAVTIAARSALRSGRLVGATEHDAVLHAMNSGASSIPVGPDGLIDLDALQRLLDAGPALVAIQHVNNETGVIQPLGTIGELVRTADSLLLADCAQSAGKLPLPDADLIAISGHKFGGPPGVGALLVRDLASLQASGGQEKGYRRGTQNGPAAAGMAEALAAGAARSAMPRLSELRRRLDDGVRALGGLVIAEGGPRLPNIGAVALPGATSSGMVVQLDLAGIAVSAGAACSSGRMEESRVLKEMGVDAEITSSMFRVSFGSQTEAEDIDAFLLEFSRIAERRRAA